MAATSQRVGGPAGGSLDSPAVPPAPKAPWWQPDWRGSRTPWLVVAVVVLLAVASAWQLGHPGPAPLTRSDVDASIGAQLDKARKEQANTPPDASVAYRRILPSLVTITAGKALGTGVVISDQGAVLTALHVVSGVSGKDRIVLRFADGTKADAKVAQRQPASDIAVLAASRLPSVVVPAVMGGGPQIGDPVFPVGNPLGLEGSLSAGVVSGLQRTIRSEGGGTLKGLIQFDAAVNPGNSGGPLLDRAGQVVGIVTGLANPSQQPYFVGIGFAVPIETAGGAAGGPSK